MAHFRNFMRTRGRTAEGETQTGITVGLRPSWLTIRLTWERTPPTDPGTFRSRVAPWEETVHQDTGLLGFGIMRASPEREAAELQHQRRLVRLQPGSEPGADVEAGKNPGPWSRRQPPGFQNKDQQGRACKGPPLYFHPQWNGKPGKRMVEQNPWAKPHHEIPSPFK